MRGKGRVRHAVHRFVGITPACAGKRCQLVHAYDDGWDHPRVCGEKSSRGRVDLLRLGLPPRMRGKAIAQTSSCRRTGITPAYAGKRSAASRPAAAARDHPRVCGEKQALLCTWMFLQGSPPRMRGKESHARRKRQAHGITPACAGKSSRPDRPSTGLLDHPRMCGEKTL